VDSVALAPQPPRSWARAPSRQSRSVLYKGVDSIALAPQSPRSWSSDVDLAIWFFFPKTQYQSS
jgi:hypothetical protein